jgi:hypothetical protein
MKRGEYDLAIGDFDQVLSIDPGFEKAIRNRAEAMKAKENIVQPSAKVTMLEAASLPRTSDEQAAYCLEASFGYTERLTRLVTILRDSRQKGQALLGGTSVPPTDRAQLVAQMKSLDDGIASNDANRKAWETNTYVFTTYMQKHGLFTKDSTLIASMSGQVRRDQEAVQSTYRACLRDCAPNDASCKATCNEKADSSDANMRMLGCAKIATQFK